MNLVLIFNVSCSLIRARLKQSVVAAVGITFGVAMFIALVSFMNGLNQLLDGLVINRTPHVRLYNEIKPTAIQPIERDKKYSHYQHFVHTIKPKDNGKEIYNSQSIIKALKYDERVLGLAPKVLTPVFFNTGPIELGGFVNGVDVRSEDRLFSLGDYVIAGNIEDLLIVNNSIFIGKGVADKMMLEVGDILQITTAQGQASSLKIVGILQFGLADIDNIQSYTSLATAQKILGKSTNYITDIQIKLKDIAKAPQLAKEYANIFRLDAIDVQTANAQFETGSSVRNIISYAVGITLLIVAGFGIYNILNMMIYEKMDSIAILKATGFSGIDVQLIFVLLALIIGIAGGVVGLLFGYILSVIINHIPFETVALPTIKTYPVSFNPTYYCIGILFAIITTFIAGLFPARKARKIDPVIIIRGK